jgi:type IV secretory pathway TraG/TraD family ATPase VirD4
MEMMAVFMYCEPAVKYLDKYYYLQTYVGLSCLYIFAVLNISIWLTVQRNAEKKLKHITLYIHAGWNHFSW